MRRVGMCVVIATILVMAVCFGVSAEAIFRGLSWGDPLEALGNAYSTNSEYEELGVEVYRKADEVLSLGSVALNRIEYHFFDGKLFRIIVYVKNESKNREAAEAMLEARYGKGKTALLSNKTTWDLGHSTVVWDWPFPGTPDPRIIFTSTGIQAQLKAYQEEQKAIQAQKDAASW